MSVMQTMKFEDSQGNAVAVCSSTIPGVMIVPPGFTAKDARSVSRVEFKQLQQALRKSGKPVVERYEQLEQRVAALEAVVGKLSPNPPKK